VAVMTHASARPEADYNTLTPGDQERFDHAMELADHATGDAEYAALMLAAAAIAGLRIPYGAEVRRCGCSCWCGMVFDPNGPDAHVIEETGGYNLGRVQCPTCADRHRETA